MWHAPRGGGGMWHHRQLWAHLVLTGIFRTGKDEFPRRKEIFPAVIYAAGSEDFGSAFSLRNNQSLDDADEVR
jgi:hypothetical protein